MTPRKSLENRLAILHEWGKKGLKVRLNPDTHTMEFSARPGVLEEWQREHLKAMNQSFTEALRYEAGLCITCGMDAAKHPTSIGRKQVFDAEGNAVLVPSDHPNKTFGMFEPVWEDADAPEHIKERICPPLFCRMCWNSGAYEKWAFNIRIGGAVAKSDSGTDTKPDPFAGFEGEPEDGLFTGTADPA